MEDNLKILIESLEDKDTLPDRNVFIDLLAKKLAVLRNQNNSSEEHQIAAHDTINLFRAMYVCQKVVNQSSVELNDMFSSISRLLFSLGKMDDWSNLSFHEFPENEVKEISALVKNMQAEFKSKEKIDSAHLFCGSKSNWLSTPISSYGSTMPEDLADESREAKKSQYFLKQGFSKSK